MLYLQATKKALHRLGLGREKLAPADTTESALGNWFMNLVQLGEREALLFVSTRSLLSFPILLGQRVPGAADLPTFLEYGITLLTDSLKTPRAQSRLLLQDLDSVALCAATDRSFIGVSNAIAGEYSRRIEAAGGLARANLGQVITDTNLSPRATLAWRNAFEVSSAQLAASLA